MEYQTYLLAEEDFFRFLWPSLNMPVFFKTRDHGDDSCGIIKENKHQIIFSKCKEVFCIFQLRVNFK